MLSVTERDTFVFSCPIGIGLIIGEAADEGLMIRSDRYFGFIFEHHIDI